MKNGDLTAAILGAGSIGASWAALFLAHGCRVRVWDPNQSLETVRSRIIATARKIGGEADMDDRLTISADVSQAVEGANFVQESGPEDLAVKRELYAEFASVLDPVAVVASSTSTFMPTALQENAGFAPQLLIGHPLNPPHIIPLVEIVPGRFTSPRTVETAVDVYQRLDRRPIVLAAERPGHLVNRLQAAVWREAIDAVASGLATVKDVDVAFTTAIGPRWALMGPFLTFHLGGGSGGLNHFLEHLGPAFQGLWDDFYQPTMDAALKEKLVSQMQDRAMGVDPAHWAQWRDQTLPEILKQVGTMQGLGPREDDERLIAIPR